MTRNELLRYNLIVIWLWEMTRKYLPRTPITEEARTNCAMLFEAFNVSHPMSSIVDDICVQWETKLPIEEVHRINLFDRLHLASQTMHFAREEGYVLPIQPLDPRILKILLHDWWLYAKTPSATLGPECEVPCEPSLVSFLHQDIPKLWQWIEEAAQRD